MYSVGYSFMTSSPTVEKTTVCALLGITMVTGLVDAVSFLSLGRVFTANMMSCFWRLRQRAYPDCLSRAR
jgi:hypothetical protein